MKRLLFSFQLSVALISALFVCSCNTKHKYYYKEDGKEEKLIEASTDSAAYLEAVQKFEISKKVHSDMKKSLGNVYSDAPISFSLLNEKKEDITYKVVFKNQDSLVESIATEIHKMPNTVEQSLSSVREEKHGKGAKYDTGGLYLAPVKVLSAKFIGKEYSNYKDVRLSFKNVSKRTVAAIRFKWYGENAFNEPADMGISSGWGGGFTDDALRPGATDNGVWSVLSKDGKKILIAYPYEVAFKDGSKWELENQ